MFAQACVCVKCNKSSCVCVRAKHPEKHAWMMLSWLRKTAWKHLARVGQNCTYIRCIYGIFGRECTIHMYIWSYTVYVVHIRFWPTLHLMQDHSSVADFCPLLARCMHPLPSQYSLPLHSTQFRSTQFRSTQFRSTQFRSTQFRSTQFRSTQFRSSLPLRSTQFLFIHSLLSVSARNRALCTHPYLLPAECVCTKQSSAPSPAGLLRDQHPLP